MTGTCGCGGFSLTMAAVLSDVLHRRSSLRWEDWNHVDSVSDWTFLSLSQLFYFYQSRSLDPSFHQLPQEEEEREINEREYLSVCVCIQYCVGVLQVSVYSVYMPNIMCPCHPVT